MQTLENLSGTRWKGTAELWLDPLGNEVERSDCTIAVDSAVVSYTWSFQGKPQQGRLVLRAGGADFSDSWHQAEPMRCDDVPGGQGLLNVLGSYAAGEGPRWGWRTTLSLRTPTGALVLQMTNITPWGEEGRAVRMVCAPDGATG